MLTKCQGKSVVDSQPVGGFYISNSETAVSNCLCDIAKYEIRKVYYTFRYLHHTVLRYKMASTKVFTGSCLIVRCRVHLIIPPVYIHSTSYHTRNRAYAPLVIFRVPIAWSNPVGCNLYSEDGIRTWRRWYPGALLKKRQLNTFTMPELKRWLSCRRGTVCGKNADLVKW